MSRDRHCAGFRVTADRPGVYDREPLVYLARHGDQSSPLTPEEARRLADLLMKAAEEAER